MSYGRPRFHVCFGHTPFSSSSSFSSFLSRNLNRHLNPETDKHWWNTVKTKQHDTTYVCLVEDLGPRFALVTNFFLLHLFFLLLFLFVILTVWWRVILRDREEKKQVMLNTQLLNYSFYVLLEISDREWESVQRLTCPVFPLHPILTFFFFLSFFFFFLSSFFFFFFLSSFFFFFLSFFLSFVWGRPLIISHKWCTKINCKQSD